MPADADGQDVPKARFDCQAWSPRRPAGSCRPLAAFRPGGDELGSQLVGTGDAGIRKGLVRQPQPLPGVDVHRRAVTLPSTVQAPAATAGRRRLPIVGLGQSVRSRISPASTSSSAWPAMVELGGAHRVSAGDAAIMIGRAVSPPPAMAPSTQLSPVASKALASSATAAASPPEVHQCVTSRSVACARRQRNRRHRPAASFQFFM